MKPDQRTLFMCLGLVVFLALNWWPRLDQAAYEYLNHAIADNLLIYATGRSLNAILSVIQSIELSVSLGAGFGVHLGEILDPLNDLIERFSGFVLYGLAGLGLQKLVLTATMSVFMKVCVTGLLLAGFVVMLFKPRFQLPVLKLLAILLMVRFAFVVEVGVVAVLDRVYFDERTEHAHSALKMTREALSNLRQEYLNAASDRGIYQGLLSASSTLLGDGERDGVADLAASAIVELIVITLVRGLLLPMLFVWVLLLLARKLLIDATS